jgi:hypothetical protein
MWPVIRTIASAVGSGSVHYGSNGVGGDTAGADGWVAMATNGDIRASDVSVEAPLRRAMARAIPTKMMRLRRLRDGRGNADLDGGGGVYKGRKAKRKNVSDKKSDRRRGR